VGAPTYNDSEIAAKLREEAAELKAEGDVYQVALFNQAADLIDKLQKRITDLESGCATTP
jgi:hypothetical protein